MSIIKLPLPQDDMAEVLEDLLRRARSGDLKFFTIMAVTKDGELLTAHGGDRTSARPFEMVGFLESLKLSVLLQDDDEVRLKVRDAMGT